MAWLGTSPRRIGQASKPRAFFISQPRGKYLDTLRTTAFRHVATSTRGAFRHIAVTKHIPKTAPGASGRKNKPRTQAASDMHVWSKAII
jgi:hypothetical protein